MPGWLFVSVALQPSAAKRFAVECDVGSFAAVCTDPVVRMCLRWLAALGASCYVVSAKGS